MKWFIACVVMLGACASSVQPTPPTQFTTSDGRRGWIITCDRGGMSACFNDAREMCWDGAYDTITQTQVYEAGVLHRSLHMVCRNAR